MSEKEEKVLGIDTMCFICRREITEDDLENKNKPMRMMSIPGFVHRKCKIDSEGFIMGTKFNEIDLTEEIKNL